MLFDFWRHKYNRCGPREKVRIAVMYQVASYWPSIESFYRACVDDDSVDIRIFFVNELSVESAQIEKTDVFDRKGNPFLFIRKKNLKISIRMLRSTSPHMMFHIAILRRCLSICGKWV